MTENILSYSFRDEDGVVYTFRIEDDPKHELGKATIEINGRVVYAGPVEDIFSRWCDGVGVRDAIQEYTNDGTVVSIDVGSKIDTYAYAWVGSQ